MYYNETSDDNTTARIKNMAGKVRIPSTPSYMAVLCRTLNLGKTKL